VRNCNLAHRERLSKQQAHLLLPFVCSQPAERALLAFGEAHPVLDPRSLDGVQQVLALKCQIRPV